MRPSIITAWLVAAGLLVAGCTSPSGGTPAAGTSPAQRAAARPVGPPGAQASGTLRLGLQENLADAAALLGWQAGYFGQNLGQYTFEPMPFTSSAAEAAALEAGQLDAAYLDPVTALQVRQSTPGGLVKIIAGAAAGSPGLAAAQMTAAGGRAPASEADRWPRGQYPAAVLVVTQRFLSASPLAVTGLVKGQVLADRFLTASRISAQAALAQRLAVIGQHPRPQTLAKSFAQYTYTENPYPAALATEANYAATAGLIKPLKNPAESYDLGPLNQVLKAAGQQEISS